MYHATRVFLLAMLMPLAFCETPDWKDLGFPVQRDEFIEACTVHAEFLEMSPDTFARYASEIGELVGLKVESADLEGVADDLERMALIFQAVDQSPLFTAIADRIEQETLVNAEAATRPQTHANVALAKHVAGIAKTTWEQAAFDTLHGEKTDEFWRSQSINGLHAYSLALGVIATDPSTGELSPFFRYLILFQLVNQQAAAHVADDPELSAIASNLLKTAVLVDIEFEGGVEPEQKDLDALAAFMDKFEVTMSSDFDLELRILAHEIRNWGGRASISKDGPIRATALLGRGRLAEMTAEATILQWKTENKASFLILGPDRFPSSESVVAHIPVDLCWEIISRDIKQVVGPDDHLGVNYSLFSPRTLDKATE